MWSSSKALPSVPSPTGLQRRRSSLSRASRALERLGKLIRQDWRLAIHAILRVARVLISLFELKIYQTPPTEMSGKLLYCLPVQPEETTAPRAGACVDQIENIIALSSALSQDMQLVVKEHPDQFRRRRPRPLGFYRTISRLPSVDLVNLDAEVHSLADRALAVVGPVGTVSIAAWRRGVPVLAMSRNWLRFAPGVAFVSSPKEVNGTLVRTLIDNRDLYSHQDRLSFETSIADLAICGNLGDQKIRSVDLGTVDHAGLSELVKEWLLRESYYSPPHDDAPSIDHYRGDGRA